MTNVFGSVWGDVFGEVWSGDDAPVARQFFVERAASFTAGAECVGEYRAGASKAASFTAGAEQEGSK